MGFDLWNKLKTMKGLIQNDKAFQAKAQRVVVKILFEMSILFWQTGNRGKTLSKQSIKIINCPDNLI